MENQVEKTIPSFSDRKSAEELAKGINKFNEKLLARVVPIISDRLTFNVIIDEL